LLLLDRDAFSSLAELPTNIFGLSVGKPHLTIYTWVFEGRWDRRISIHKGYL